MAKTYNRINTAATGGGGSGTPFSSSFVVASWSLSTSYYLINILESTHGKGVSPGVEVFELVGSDYEQISIDRIKINASGDIELRVLASPDLRFNGKVVVLD